AWFTNHLFFEGKMRAIFSMLFGGGAVLLISRAEGRGAGAEVADVYYRRTLWLIAFGLIHAYFIWEGDILFTYGLFGLALYPLRNLPARTLVLAGVVLFAALTPLCLVEARSIRSLREKAVAANAAVATGRTLTDAQRK